MARKFHTVWIDLASVIAAQESMTPSDDSRIIPREHVVFDDLVYTLTQPHGGYKYHRPVVEPFGDGYLVVGNRIFYDACEKAGLKEIGVDVPAIRGVRIPGPHRMKPADHGVMDPYAEFLFLDSPVSALPGHLFTDLTTEARELTLGSAQSIISFPDRRSVCFSYSFDRPLSPFIKDVLDTRILSICEAAEIPVRSVSGMRFT